MKTFLEKLDRQAERLLNIMDNQINQPIAESLNLTGTLFMQSDTSSGENQEAQLTVSPTHEAPQPKLVERSAKRSVVLQKADAK